MKVITTAVEHPAVLQPARRLKAQGFTEVELPVNSVGQIDLDQLRAELKGTKNALVSVMWANNETGTIFPVKEVAEIAKEFGATMHTDAVQIAGKERIDMQKVPVDTLAISGHKFHAPKGIGALYVRKGTKLKPFMIGGHQESGRRAGTENVPYIVGLAKACELAMQTWKPKPGLSAQCATALKPAFWRHARTCASMGTRHTACQTLSTSRLNTSRERRLRTVSPI